MNSQQQFDTPFGGGRDMLNYTHTATPSADVWLAAFTTDFIAHADADHGARALMSGLRFYTPAFVAELAALPPVEARLPPLTASGARAIYTATGPIILHVYAQLIQRHAPHAAIHAAFTEAMPGLLTQYHSTPATDNGIGY